MQVLCKLSDTVSDVRCSICGQGFLVYWSRTSASERDETRRTVTDALAAQHNGPHTIEVHPRTGFNVPAWTGTPSFSGAAMLGGAEGWSL